MPQKSREAGNLSIEFVLVTAFIYTPLILGVLALGGNLTRSIQVTQITRDAGRMWGEGTDISRPGAQNLILRLASGLNITATGGNGVLIFSRIAYVGDAQCTAAGLTLSTCTNLNNYVVTKRVTIGNSSLRQSNYATPAPQLIDASGIVSNYLTDTTARATGFTAITTLNPGEDCYLTEAYFRSQEFDIPGFMTGTGIYAHAVF